jgi:hypothetical protein
VEEGISSIMTLTTYRGDAPAASESVLPAGYRNSAFFEMSVNFDE